jgi:anaerobic magnesium-protoporphyrin IX monomethyl ester cyclase
MGNKFVLVVVPSMENAYHNLKDFVAIVPPIGLISIAAVLEKKGYAVRVIDADAEQLSFEEILHKTVDEKPDYVGANTMTATMGISNAFFIELRKRLPQVKIIVGGPHASALPVETLKDCAAIDIIVKGEGEEIVDRLMDVLNGGGELSGVKGIAYRENSGIFENIDSDLAPDLNKLSLPAYHLLNYNLYRAYGWNKWTSGYRFPLGVIFTGRGCLGKCNFCASRVIFGDRVRYFPLDRIKEEIDLLVDKYKIKVLYFQDDNFTANRFLVNEICNYLINKGYNKRLEIMVSSRVDTVELATLRHMRQAGMRWICFGVESGNQSILDRMGKKITLECIRKAFNYANTAGLFVAGNYMIGHIGETPKTARDTINLACELKQDYVSFAIAIPLPGSGLYQYCVDNKIELPPWGEFGSVNSAPIPLNRALNAVQLIELRRSAVKSFFKRPRYVIRTLSRFNAPAVLADFLKMFFALQNEIRQRRY